jgi:hypothetical protein
MSNGDPLADEAARLAELEPAQLEALGRLAKEHPRSTWHFNDCGCCICVHPGGDLDQGYIINSEGDVSHHTKGDT